MSCRLKLIVITRVSCTSIKLVNKKGSELGIYIPGHHRYHISGPVINNLPCRIRSSEWVTLMIIYVASYVAGFVEGGSTGGGTGDEWSGCGIPAPDSSAVQWFRLWLRCIVIRPLSSGWRVGMWGRHVNSSVQSVHDILGWVFGLQPSIKEVFHVPFVPLQVAGLCWYPIHFLWCADIESFSRHFAPWLARSSSISCYHMTA